MDQTNHDIWNRLKNLSKYPAGFHSSSWTYIELASLLKSSQLFFFLGKFAKTPEFRNLLSQRGYHDTKIVTED